MLEAEFAKDEVREAEVNEKIYGQNYKKIPRSQMATMNSENQLSNMQGSTVSSSFPYEETEHARGILGIQEVANIHEI